MEWLWNGTIEREYSLLFPSWLIIQNYPSREKTSGSVKGVRRGALYMSIACPVFAKAKQPRRGHLQWKTLTKMKTSTLICLRAEIRIWWRPINALKNSLSRLGRSFISVIVCAYSHVGDIYITFLRSCTDRGESRRISVMKPSWKGLFPWKIYTHILWQSHCTW